VIGQIGPLAYCLELSPSLSNIHNVFHVFQLQKHIPDLTQEIRVEMIELRDNLTYPKSPEQILDRCDKALSSEVIPLVMIQWRNHIKEEVMWELKGTIREKYSQLFK